VFDHVTLRVSSRAASEQFYELVLGLLGVEPSYTGDDFAEWHDFSLAQASREKPTTTGLHLGFVAGSREQVDAFWRAGVAAGHRDDGAPGPRPEYREDYYGAFLLDPDGNSAEAVHHGALRQGGVVDHLWIRVADRPTSRAFYERVAPHAGFRLKHDLDDRTQFVGETGSFSLVDGEPAQNVHLAFPAADDAAVEAFHAAATEAGYRGNGPPGERPHYHHGYYAAYVLDPDGNNVELVNHNRE
jgi:catechol 2,3-dioxygenase-like lactoylglutathione lyase family enzyme